MGAKLKPVHDLKTYWEREMRFRRRLSLIDGKNVFSLDAEDCDTLPYLAARPEPVRSAFTIDYFSNLIKAVPSDSNVTNGLDTDKPVKVSFGLADGNGVVRYLLAPRIED